MKVSARVKILFLAVLIFIIGAYFYFTNDPFGRVCSSIGLQPVYMTCVCEGEEQELTHNEGAIEGTETICLGKVISRSCTSGDQVVSCNPGQFPNEVFRIK